MRKVHIKGEQGAEQRPFRRHQGREPLHYSPLPELKAVPLVQQQGRHVNYGVPTRLTSCWLGVLRGARHCNYLLTGPAESVRRKKP